MDRDLKNAFPSLHEVSLPKSAVQVQCFLWRVSGSMQQAGLIRFSGKCHAGSAGADDAVFMQSRIREFCDLPPGRRPAGLVVDLTNLGYTWGDDLHISSFTTRKRIPIRVVVQVERLEAFKQVALESEIRTNIIEACHEMEVAIKEGQVRR